MTTIHIQLEISIDMTTMRCQFQEPQLASSSSPLSLSLNAHMHAHPDICALSCDRTCTERVMTGLHAAPYEIFDLRHLCDVGS